MAAPVHTSDGIAKPIGPEPCVVGRETGGEASAGAPIGQRLSRERINRDADAVVTAEGETGARVNASAFPVLGGRRPWHVRKLLDRKPGDLDLCRARRARADNARRQEKSYGFRLIPSSLSHGPKSSFPSASSGQAFETRRLSGAPQNEDLYCNR